MKQYKFELDVNIPDWQDFHEYKKRVKIDKQVCYDNIYTLYNITHLNLYALFGTLLGLVRDKDLLEHDTDVDLSIHYYDVKYLWFMHKEQLLLDNGYKLVRVYKRNPNDHMEDVITFIRNDDVIDLYVLKEHENNQLIMDDGSPNAPFIFDSKDFNHLNIRNIFVPDNAVNYLLRSYGPNWAYRDDSWHWGKDPNKG
jgi:hypothetical protein